MPYAPDPVAAHTSPVNKTHGPHLPAKPLQLLRMSDPQATYSDRSPGEISDRPPGEITELLAEWRAGNPAALERLMPLVYEALKRIARAHLSNERRNHTLTPTELVHEAYLRLSGLEQMDWRDRTHFFALAATTMRRILVDHARTRHRAKRGGQALHVDLHEATALAEPTAQGICDFDLAIEQLAKLDAQKARLVELRCFAGLTMEEIAVVLSCSTATATRHWRLARAWLHRQLQPASHDA